MSVSKIEDLKVFKNSHELTLEFYRITKHFPDDEKFGLTSQIRRASSSICANLMEGSHRNNRKEYRQFVGIARGSIGELKYHLLLSKDLGYVNNDQYNILIKKINEISKMLYGLTKSLEKTDTRTDSSHSQNSKGVL